MMLWPHRLSVRTLGSHPKKRGSTPLGATKIFCIKYFRKIKASGGVRRRLGGQVVSLDLEPFPSRPEKDFGIQAVRKSEVRKVFMDIISGFFQKKCQTT